MRFLRLSLVNALRSSPKKTNAFRHWDWDREKTEEHEGSQNRRRAVLSIDLGELASLQQFDGQLRSSLSHDGGSIREALLKERPVSLPARYTRWMQHTSNSSTQGMLDKPLPPLPTPTGKRQRTVTSPNLPNFSSLDDRKKRRSHSLPAAFHRPSLELLNRFWRSENWNTWHRMPTTTVDVGTKNGVIDHTENLTIQPSVQRMKSHLSPPLPRVQLSSPKQDNNFMPYNIYNTYIPSFSGMFLISHARHSVRSWFTGYSTPSLQNPRTRCSSAGSSEPTSVFGYGIDDFRTSATTLTECGGRVMSSAKPEAYRSGGCE